MLLAASFDNPTASVDLNCHTSMFNGVYIYIYIIYYIYYTCYVHIYVIYIPSFGQYGWTLFPLVSEDHNHILTWCLEDVH